MPEAEDPKPPLNDQEEQEAEHRTSVRARVVHEAIRRDGETELGRSASALGWSALAAGMSMGLSLVAEGALRHGLPDAKWGSLVAKLGYPLGYIIVIVGKQQLFTESTLTPIIPALENKSWSTWGKLLKLWAIVLVANLAGAHLIAWFFSNSPALSSELRHVLFVTSQEATSFDGWSAFARGIPSGWLIAMIVWLKAATDTDELMIILILTYFVGVGEFTHIITGSVEYLYLVFSGAADWFSYVRDYAFPVLLGNIVGGSGIVAALAHAQVRAENDT